MTNTEVSVGPDKAHLLQHVQDTFSKMLEIIVVCTWSRCQQYFLRVIPVCLVLTAGISEPPGDHRAVAARPQQEALQPRQVDSFSFTCCAYSLSCDSSHQQILCSVFFSVQHILKSCKSTKVEPLNAVPPGSACPAAKSPRWRSADFTSQRRRPTTWGKKGNPTPTRGEGVTNEWMSDGQSYMLTVCVCVCV